jgi:hypothetical protein
MAQSSALPKYTITYLAHGQDSSKYQTILSIYTLLHHIKNGAADFQFVIYTDPDTSLLNKYLSELPVKLEILTKEQVANFRGTNNYSFRIKLLVIKDYFSKYDSNLFYIDSDTFFLRNPIALLDTLSAKHSIMNAKEYNLVDGGEIEFTHWFNLRQALKRHEYKVNNRLVKIPLETHMWNSGIIGIGRENSSSIDQIISLNDELFEKSKVFNVEQFAISYILQQSTELHSTEDYINHYWSKDIKNTFNARIPSFLAENAHKPKQELYDLAYDFARKFENTKTELQESLQKRLKARLELIIKVARNGHL